MGKSTKPLTILVADPDLYNTPEIQALAAQGHVVHPPGDVLSMYDVIIGPRCWCIVLTMGKLKTYIKLMLAGMRAVKYPKVKA